MLTTLVWLAQQAPAAPTPTDLRPALYGVGGTLLGVAASTIVQLVNARIQRRHENRGRAFDARFTLYSRFLADLDEWLDVIPRVEALVDSGDVGSHRAADAEALARLPGDLNRSAAAIQILSDVSTRDALKPVVLAVRDRRQPTADENYSLRTAIRQELGLPRT